MNTPLRSSTLPRSRRGSVLIVALIFSAALAVSLGSFLRLATQSTQLSYRSFYAGTSMNAAETGLEQAMWAINKRLDGDTSVWTNNGWTVLGTGAARRTFALGTVSGGATVEVKVYVSSANLVGLSPFVIARSIITPVSGSPIERWIQVTLSKRSRFSTGLVAKDDLTFSGGNAIVDSYDSRLGAYTPEPATTNRFDRGSAGSKSVQADSVTVSNSKIFGFAVVGTSDASGLDVQTNGRVGPFGANGSTNVSGVDMDHVMTDFTANFEDERHPDAYTGNGSYTVSSMSNLTLPRPQRTVTTGNGNNQVTTTLPADQADDQGYYNYNVSGISGSLVIKGPVRIRMTDTTSTIAISGNDSITINAPSGGVTPKLEIFTKGRVNIGGNGVVNSGNPINFKLWGTLSQSDSPAQSIDIHGNGVLSAVVYAPNAVVTMKGGGSGGNVYGAVVGKEIKITGGSAFHYDESLADLDTGEPLGLDDWNEFVSYADRNTYSDLMDW